VTWLSTPKLHAHKLSWRADANSEATDAFTALQTDCDRFEGPGKLYYDALCSTTSSVDAQLLTSIYQCADPSKENIASFNIDGMHLEQLVFADRQLCNCTRILNKIVSSYAMDSNKRPAVPHMP
jgi:hypothetical protein